jgi:hypothetical protein
MQDMTTGGGAARERWHVGKEIPLALIMTIGMSVASGIWYASSTSARITQIEDTVRTQVSMRDEFIQLKEQMRSVERTLVRMETLLDRRGDLGTRKSNSLGINKQ